MHSLESLDTVVNSLRSTLGDNFIICLESSASLLGLSDGDVLPLTIYSTEPTDLENVEVILVETLDRTETQVIDGLTCTNTTRTLIELLDQSRDPQTIVESLCSYYYNISNQNWEILETLAEENDVLEELESYMEDAIDHANN